MSCLHQEFQWRAQTTFRKLARASRISTRRCSSVTQSLFDQSTFRIKGSHSLFFHSVNHIQPFSARHRLALIHQLLGSQTIQSFNHLYTSGEATRKDSCRRLLPFILGLSVLLCTHRVLLLGYTTQHAADGVAPESVDGSEALQDQSAHLVSLYVCCDALFSSVWQHKQEPGT